MASVRIGDQLKTTYEDDSQGRSCDGSGGGQVVQPPRAADLNGRKNEYFQWNGFLHSTNVIFLAKYKEIQQMLFF